jgi:hypothetical protein
LGKLLRERLLHPRGCRIADVCAQRRDIDSNIADPKARLGKSALTRGRCEKRERGPTDQITRGQDLASGHWSEASVEAACLRLMDGILDGGLAAEGPVGRGVGRLVGVAAGERQRR